ncbi:DUF1684 domain-containing protein [Moheibacter stercoris]|uniref:Uncharacterized protein (DUF1684 family) n=1 Tax=Moheibacter stercoris TaxID=1628251 RepID=A0ABV2LWB2_9FLAO
MKHLILASLILFFLGISCGTQKKVSTYTYQKELRDFYNNPKTTPLKGEEISQFKGITFFPIDNQFKVLANFKAIENGKILPFPTSAKKIKHYKEYGIIQFTIQNQPLELTLYQSEPLHEGYENSLFLPFTDETNGDTSYGGGRYLDLETTDIQNNQIWIDFNKAYNPYCAYSKHYNCPIPPANNYLEIEIKAGVSYLE